MKIGLIGCGNMGSGMAKQLLSSGYQLTCYDLNEQSIERIQMLGASIAPSLVQLASDSEIIILSLPNAQVVESVMQEINTSVNPDTVVLDTSTSEPDTTQQLAAKAAAKNYVFIDGPVSGGPVAANAGTMTMLLGGDPDGIAKLKPVLDTITAKTVVVGASGAGHAAKIANNMLCAANLVLVSEALRLGNAAGVSAEDLLEGINAGSGRSGVSEVNYPTWILNNDFNSGFTMGLMRKDVRLALKLAESSNVDLIGFQNIADIWLMKSAHIPDTADFNEVVKDQT
jgi:3-hydroxyisobutyrate dehydrogenase